MPGSDGVAHRTPAEVQDGSEQARTALLGGLVSTALALVWLAVDPRTPDLAAQVYRVGLFRADGFSIWDEHWYAGHSLPGYSLIYPALGALLGARTVGALCAPVSAVLFGLLAVREYGRAARWGTAAFAVAAVGDVWMGRLSFALGVSLALAAALAYQRGRPAAAALLTALAAAASPVAGLLLGLAALAVAAQRRSARALLALALPGAAVVLALAWLFPEGGTEPFPTLSFLACAAVTVAFLAALPARASLLRRGGAIYLLACLACLAIGSPVGSNIERMAVLLAAPLLLCALAQERGGVWRRGGAAGLLGVLALAGMGVWVLWGPVRETEAVAGSGSTSAAYYAPLERFLDGVAGPVRVEVPMTRSHWEAALLAPRVSLARGWEKQLDERYDGVLLNGRLTAASYRAWLEREAVAYVALPDASLDPSSAAEGRLIEAGLPYLRPVFHSRHWRVYEVLGAWPLASGPGRLTWLGHESFALQARRAGSFLVRERYTRYWTVTAGEGCVSEGREGFTRVRAARAGRVVVTARFSLARAFGSGASCRGA